MNMQCKTGLSVQPPSTQAVTTKTHMPQVKDWLLHGYDLQSRGQLIHALRCYDEALKLKPNLIAGWILKGSALRQLERPFEAVLCFDMAMVIDPKSTTALVHKATALMDCRQYLESLHCYEKALRISTGPILQSADYLDQL